MYYCVLLPPPGFYQAIVCSLQNSLCKTNFQAEQVDFFKKVVLSSQYEKKA